MNLNSYVAPYWLIFLAIYSLLFGDTAIKILSQGALYGLIFILIYALEKKVKKKQKG